MRTPLASAAPRRRRAPATPLKPADDPARQALARLIAEGQEDYRDLSRWLGRNDAYLQQYLHRGTPARLREEDRRRLAAYFGVTDQALGGPPAIAPAMPTPAPSVPPRRRAPVRDSRLARVPLIARAASAGPGALADDEATLGHFGIDVDWLRRRLGVAPDAVQMLVVTGDSMAPTLGDGDDILVDTAAATAPLAEGIFVLRQGDALLVKRVMPGPAPGTVTLISDNPFYPPMTDVALDQVAIVGRVVWTGRRLRA